MSKRAETVVMMEMCSSIEAGRDARDGSRA